MKIGDQLTQADYAESSADKFATFDIALTVYMT